ncbi:MAG: esterase-like activity of phytase family protein [Pseudomonadota bacterium]
MSAGSRRINAQEGLGRTESNRASSQTVTGLFALALCACAFETGAQPAAQDQPPSFTLTERSSVALPFETWAHGLSALAFDNPTKAPNRLLALSDTGQVTVLTMEFDQAGTLSDTRLVDSFPLAIGPAPDTHTGDIEAAVQVQDNEWFAALERPARLAVYSGRGFSAFALDPAIVAPPAGLTDQPENTGIEAVAQLPDGSLMLFAEAAKSGIHPLWIGNPDAWQEFGYRSDSGYAPVEAVYHPCGGVIVLERVANLLAGLAIRLTYIPEEWLARRDQERTVNPVPIGAVEPTEGWGNFEGMTLRSRPGQSCADPVDLFMVSDDNALRLLPRLLLHYELTLTAK